MDSEAPVLSWVPVFLFSTGTRNNDVTSVLRGQGVNYPCVRAKDHAEQRKG